MRYFFAFIIYLYCIVKFFGWYHFSVDIIFHSDIIFVIEIIALIKKVPRFNFSVAINPSILSSLPIQFSLLTNLLFQQIHKEVGKKVKAYWCAKNWDEPFYWKAYEVYMLFLILVGPLCVMTFAYSFICWEVCRIMERRSIMTSRYA